MRSSDAELGHFPLLMSRTYSRLIMRDGTVPLAFGDARVNLIDARDVGAAAAAVLSPGSPDVPARVEYALTPLGGTLTEPIRQLTEWAMTHLDDVRAARLIYQG